ncbi:MAG UNVERIFIED_CONTAM: hypothetical protein LVR18_34425 [Planctomycetaceae bacterium]
MSGSDGADVHRRLCADGAGGQFDEGQPSTFNAMLVLGVGAGSLLAGWWSSGRVELGMVPFGTLLMGVACTLLYFTSDAPGWLAGC